MTNALPEPRLMKILRLEASVGKLSMSGVFRGGDGKSSL